MTDPVHVKGKSPPPVGRGPSTLAVSALAALVALAMGLFVFVSGCESNEAETGSAPPDAVTKDVLLNIGVSDKTEANPPPTDSFLVRVPGRGSWRPRLKWEEASSFAQSQTFGTYRTGRQEMFYIYPTGLAGRKIEVPFEMKPNMISGIASSKTYVDVYDDSLVVRGPAITGGRAAFER